MDQSASVFSERGSALFVTFSPKLTARPVFFPTTRPELTFVIAQSFVAADKQVTGPIHYNLRVVECSLAAAYLNAVLNPPTTRLPGDASPLGVSLQGFQETYFACLAQHEHQAVPRTAHQELREMLDLARATLTKEEGYTRDEIAAVLGMSVAELDQRFTAKFPVRADRFKPRQRTLHVFGEAERVLQFLELLEDETKRPTIPSSSSSSSTTTTTPTTTTISFTNFSTK